MNRVIHFEIAVNNPKREVEFYQEVFNWEIREYEGPADYWLITTGEEDTPGINGGLFHRNDTFSGTVNTIAVDSVEAYVDKVNKAGGIIVVEPHAIPGVGYSAYCKDPDGVLFGIHEEDPDAA